MSFTQLVGVSPTTRRVALSNYNMLPWFLKRVGILIKQIDCAKLNFDLKQCLELTTAFEREEFPNSCAQ